LAAKTPSSSNLLANKRWVYAANLTDFTFDPQRAPHHPRAVQGAHGASPSRPEGPCAGGEARAGAHLQGGSRAPRPPRGGPGASAPRPPRGGARPPRLR